jgi:hypothetical protein
MNRFKELMKQHVSIWNSKKILVTYIITDETILKQFVDKLFSSDSYSYSYSLSPINNGRKKGDK